MRSAFSFSLEEYRWDCCTNEEYLSSLRYLRSQCLASAATVVVGGAWWAPGPPPQAHVTITQAPE